MKTFYYYENSRKRYRASHSASGYIGYAMEYKVKSVNVLGRKFYNWVCVVEMVSKLKFKEGYPLQVVYYLAGDTNATLRLFLAPKISD